MYYVYYIYRMYIYYIYIYEQIQKLCDIFYSLFFYEKVDNSGLLI